MSAITGFMRTALHQEPIIMWSCMISAVGQPDTLKHTLLLKRISLGSFFFRTAGLALPLVVPPIRESFSKADVKSPPPVKQVRSLYCLLPLGASICKHLPALQMIQAASDRKQPQ